MGRFEQSLPPTVDGCRWGGRYCRRWPVGRLVSSMVAGGKPVPSTVAGGEDGTVDCGRREGRWEGRWPVEFFSPNGIPSPRITVPLQSSTSSTEQSSRKSLTTVGRRYTRSSSLKLLAKECKTLLISPEQADAVQCTCRDNSVQNLDLCTFMEHY